jgi:hypothetical protein
MELVERESERASMLTYFRVQVLSTQDRFFLGGSPSPISPSPISPSPSLLPHLSLLSLSLLISLYPFLSLPISSYLSISSSYLLSLLPIPYLSFPYLSLLSLSLLPLSLLPFLLSLHLPIPVHLPPLYLSISSLFILLQFCYSYAAALFTGNKIIAKPNGGHNRDGTYKYL